MGVFSESALALLVRSPEGAKRNPGLRHRVLATPHSSSLHAESSRSGASGVHNHRCVLQYGFPLSWGRPEALAKGGRVGSANRHVSFGAPLHSAGSSAARHLLQPAGGRKPKQNRRACARRFAPTPKMNVAYAAVKKRGSSSPLARSCCRAATSRRRRARSRRPVSRAPSAIARSARSRCRAEVSSSICFSAP